MAIKEWLLFLPFVGFGITANMLIKTGLLRLGLGNLASLKSITVVISSPWVWGGVICYALGLLTYIYLLNRYPLNLVQPFSAVAFVGVILASYFILSEPIPSVRWAGVALICVGIVLVGRSA